jgi:myo-inositol catabolism protein IolC
MMKEIKMAGKKTWKIPKLKVMVVKSPQEVAKTKNENRRKMT